jgi:hypothetical protein
MQSAVEFYLEAYKAAMKSGNPYAVTCSYAHDNICFWSGKELNAVVDSMKKTMNETKYHKNMLGLALILPTFRMALRLISLSDAPEQDGLTHASIIRKHVTHLHTINILFVSLSEALLFREFDKAREATDEYFLVDDSVGCHFSMSTPNMCFRTL